MHIDPVTVSAGVVAVIGVLIWCAPILRLAIIAGASISRHCATWLMDNRNLSAGLLMVGSVVILGSSQLPDAVAPSSEDVLDKCYALDRAARVDLLRTMAALPTQEKQLAFFNSRSPELTRQTYSEFLDAVAAHAAEGSLGRLAADLEL